MCRGNLEQVIRMIHQAAKQSFANILMIIKWSRANKSYVLLGSTFCQLFM